MTDLFIQSCHFIHENRLTYAQAHIRGLLEAEAILKLRRRAARVHSNQWNVLCDAEQYIACQIEDFYDAELEAEREAA